MQYNVVLLLDIIGNSIFKWMKTIKIISSDFYVVIFLRINIYISVVIDAFHDWIKMLKIELLPNFRRFLISALKWNRNLSSL